MANPFEGIEIDLWKIFPPFAVVLPMLSLVLLLREVSPIVMPTIIWHKANWFR